MIALDQDGNPIAKEGFEAPPEPEVWEKMKRQNAAAAEYVRTGDPTSGIREGILPADTPIGDPNVRRPLTQTGPPPRRRREVEEEGEEV